jgi:hypothetical protein
MGDKSRKPPLAIIPPPARTSVPPPRKLGEVGQILWDNIQAEFVIDDAGNTELLMQCCLAADRAEMLADLIEHDGATIVTKMGLKAHPCLKDEIAARSFVARCLQRLGVTEQRDAKIGRPAKSYGWRGWQE